MKHELFRKLIELRLINVGDQIGVEYFKYSLTSKRVKEKGVFPVSKIYAHPLLLGTVVEIQPTEEDVIRIEPGNIKMINGKTPAKLAAEFGIRPDGLTNDAPKRRGRKPKVRPEEEWESERQGN